MGDSIIQDANEKGTFYITKASGEKHTIKFASESNDRLPSCSCKDWVRWHIPCKHFFTIFREKPEWTWDSLPEKYLKSAYLSSDNEALTNYFKSQGANSESLTFLDNSE